MNNDLILKRKLQTLLPQESGCWSIDSPMGKLFSLVASIPEPPPFVCFYCGAKIGMDHYSNCTRLK